jgi:hypothetical protein
MKTVQDQIKDVPRGTTDEVSSHVRLDLPFVDGKAAAEIVPPCPRIHHGRALAPIPERSTSPRAISNLWWWIVSKALDLKRPIREADIAGPAAVSRRS